MQNVQSAVTTNAKPLPETATKLLKALQSPTGQTYGLTSRQIRARFGVANPRDLVYRLRQNGVRISTEEAVIRGATRMKYFLD